MPAVFLWKMPVRTLCWLTVVLKKDLSNTTEDSQSRITTANHRKSREMWHSPFPLALKQNLLASQIFVSATPKW